MRSQNNSPNTPYLSATRTNSTLSTSSEHTYKIYTSSLAESLKTIQQRDRFGEQAQRLDQQNDELIIERNELKEKIVQMVLAGREGTPVSSQSIARSTKLPDPQFLQMARSQSSKTGCPESKASYLSMPTTTPPTRSSKPMLLDELEEKQLPILHHDFELIPETPNIHSTTYTNTLQISTRTQTAYSMPMPRMTSASCS